MQWLHETLFPFYFEQLNRFSFNIPLHRTTQHLNQSWQQTSTNDQMSPSADVCWIFIPFSTASSLNVLRSFVGRTLNDHYEHLMWSDGYKKWSHTISRAKQWPKPEQQQTFYESTDEQSLPALVWIPIDVAKKQRIYCTRNCGKSCSVAHEKSKTTAKHSKMTRLHTHFQNGSKIVYVINQI